MPKVRSQAVEAVVRGLGEELYKRLVNDVPPHILAILLTNPDWLDEHLTEEKAGAFLDLEVSTLQSKRLNGTGPRFFRGSRRCVKYTRRELLAYQARHTVCSTSEPIGAGASQAQDQRKRTI